MSRRSVQAFNLGRTLSDGAGVEVRLVHDSGARWCVEWANGPTVDQMREHVERALASGPYPDMRDRTIRYFRGKTARAWAARAIAARRDGSLGPVRQACLSWRDYTTCSVIEQLVDSTPYPDRASAPADEPLIEQLLTAGEHNEYRMARILTNADRARKLTADRSSLRALPGLDRWPSGIARPISTW